MTKDEFKARVEEFWNWTASHDRDPYLWFMSLQDWAGTNFNREYEKQYPPADKLVAAWLAEESKKVPQAKYEVVGLCETHKTATFRQIGSDGVFCPVCDHRRAQQRTTGR